MIAHLDMDAFFARCEKDRRPELEEKPVVICIYTRNRSSGAVSTSSYEARELGIESGMPIERARMKADEETVFLEADQEYYRRRSEEVFSVVSSYTAEIQKTSIDEGYFRLEGSARKKAEKIKAGIESLGLSASIGIAPNRLLAKIASEEDKPDGLCQVRENEKKDFLESKDLQKLHGVGGKTAEKLESLGIRKVRDLREAESSLLIEEFGRDRAASLRKKARGEGSTELDSKPRKQLSRIKTMERNSSDREYIAREMKELRYQLDERLENRGKGFRKITVIGVDTELNKLTRSRKVDTSDSLRQRKDEIEDLLSLVVRDSRNDLRRIGIRASDLIDREVQSTLQAF